MTGAQRQERTTRASSGRRGIACLAIGWAMVGGVGEARGDRITLRGGGQVKGKIVADKEHPGHWILIGEVGKTQMALRPDQVVQVTPEKGPLDEYVPLLEKPRTTAREEFALGTWCGEHGLGDLATVHFERALKFDSTFEAAHRKLGHVSMGGRWLNADEVKEAQGLVRYKGRWVTPEEKERRDLLAASAAEGSAWVKKIKALRDACVSGPADRGGEAERRLLAIDEPSAVGPILKVLGDDPIPAIRAMAAKILGGIPGPESTAGLVGRIAEEDDEEVRRVTLNELARREKSDVLPGLARALRSGDYRVVNRAGWALGMLGASTAVPRLVASLITIEQQVVLVNDGPPQGNPASGFVLEGGGPSIPILTPPAVGPGVVAYGATSIPFTALNGSSINIGANGGRGPVPRLVPIEHRNDAVLAALVKLTGRDFGYDIPTWKRWIATSFKVDAAPTRRVIEP